MGNNEKIEKLFFELASESRLSILHELQNENLKMHEIARRLDVTATEAFRQLQRLSKALLVQKQPEGTFAITFYGKLVLHLSSSFEFVSKHREYFLTHDVWQIPPTIRESDKRAFANEACNGCDGEHKQG